MELYIHSLILTLLAKVIPKLFLPFLDLVPFFFSWSEVDESACGVLLVSKLLIQLNSSPTNKPKKHLALVLMSSLI